MKEGFCVGNNAKYDAYINEKVYTSHNFFTKTLKN